MPQVPPPVLGFNNNVRYRGRVFHIQTEDSGVKTPRIVTHLFADGGHIIKTTRTEYSDILDRSDLAQVVREMMKTQHKAMFFALRGGELDAVLEANCGPLPVAASVPPEVPTEVPAAPRAKPPPGPFRNANRVATAPTVQGSVEADSAEPAQSASPASEPKSVPSPPAGSTSSQVPASPASKGNRSLFGDSVISEKSLDEVILSYLAEDLEGSD